MLAKMGKDKPASMGILAKISADLECGLDDIVEITADTATEGKENG